jgi:hypothetical protein
MTSYQTQLCFLPSWKKSSAKLKDSTMFCRPQWHSRVVWSDLLPCYFVYISGFCAQTLIFSFVNSNIFQISIFFRNLSSRYTNSTSVFLQICLQRLPKLILTIYVFGCWCIKPQSKPNKPFNNMEEVIARLIIICKIYTTSTETISSLIRVYLSLESVHFSQLLMLLKPLIWHITKVT